ncbi:MAG TPA: hypothetical protein DHM37_01795, partial [Candidatus Cloacimonas sp.]|nr:hypothetical protein [Candidatus Cloacimonas sp.]
KNNIKHLKKVMTAFNISLFTQTLVDTILDFKETFLEHTQKVIRKRNVLFENLNKIDNIGAKPSATNFLAFTAYNKSSKLFQY